MAFSPKGAILRGTEREKGGIDLYPSPQIGKLLKSFDLFPPQSLKILKV